MHSRPLAPGDQSLESQRTQAVSETIASIHRHVDVKFGEMDGKLSNIRRHMDVKFGEIDGRLLRMDVRLGLMENKFDTFERKFDDFARKLDMLIQLQ